MNLRESFGMTEAQAAAIEHSAYDMNRMGIRVTAWDIAKVFYGDPWHPDLSLGEFLRMHRKRLKLTQSEVSQAAGISRNELSLLENDHCQGVTVGTLDSLRKPLGVMMTQLCEAWLVSEKRRAAHF